MPDAPVPSATSAPASAPAADAQHSNINVQQLADKVYSLLLADLRLGWARGEAPVGPTRKGEG